MLAGQKLMLTVVDVVDNSPSCYTGNSFVRPSAAPT